MLLIRKLQFDMLGQSRRKQFEDRLLRIFESDYPDVCEGLGHEKAQSFITRTMAAAERYGIEVEGAVIVFLGLRVENGEDFQLSPDGEWALQMLANQTVPDVLRVSLVRDRLRERNQGRRIEKFTGVDTTDSTE